MQFQEAPDHSRQTWLEAISLGADQTEWWNPGKPSELRKSTVDFQLVSIRATSLEGKWLHNYALSTHQRHFKELVEDC